MQALNYYWLLLVLLFLSPPLSHIATAQQPSDSSSSSSDGNDDANPSLTVIVVVLALVFFLTGCISFYIHLCSDASATPTVAATAGLSKSGIEKSVIDTFPTFLYSEVKELKYGKESLECAVCLNEFQEDETLRLLPKCDHVFHTECIDAWLDGHSTCPVCRANLLPDPNNNNSQCEFCSREIEEQAPSGERIPTFEVQIPISEEDNMGEEKENLKLSNSKLPRSHSTGHSLSRPGSDSERFTLKLPAEVRRQLVARSKLKRATSQLNLARASSSRRGYRGGGGEGSGSSRYGGVLGRSIARAVSFKWTLPRARADGEVTEVGKGSKRVLGTAVTPLEGLHSSLPV